MKWILGTLLVLAGCSDLERPRSFALGVRRRRRARRAAATLRVGDSCDPIAWDTFGAGLVCGVSSCDGDGGSLVHDCIPPCTIGGVPVYQTISTGTCEFNGLMSTDDGRCIVPCFYRPLCDALGGVSC
jgi:hypothetical protein